MSLPDSQSMSLSHTRKRPRTGSYSSWNVVESEATESEAVRLLAARIPPELFENILFYVNVDRVSQREEVFRTNGKYLARNRGQPSPIDVLTDLKQCSLVCLFWANRCREHMFSERTLVINSYEDAEIFRRYVVEGCPRLTPVHQLIKRIGVIQNYSGGLTSQPHKRQTSFLPLLYLPVIQDKFEQLFISGPVPDGFNRAKLDTPHWGIPPSSMVLPSTFLQSLVSIRHLHLPSFYHVTKYIRHFACAVHIDLKAITWDDEIPYTQPHASSTIVCQRRPRSLVIVAEGVCTDTVHLALTAVMMNPNCPLHRVSEEERLWMIGLMTLLWGHEKDPDVFIGFDVSAQTTTMRLGRFHLAFEEASAHTDRSASALSVVGIHAYILVSSDLFAKFDALVIYARTYPTIRAFVVLFDSFALLQESMKPFVEVLGTATEAIEFVCAYEEQEEIKVPRGFWRKTGRVLGVDPVTLEPTGRIWADLQAEWIRNKSSEILRRELKKRR